MGGEGHSGPEHRGRHTHGDGAAEDILAAEDIRIRVGVWYHGKRKMLSKGFPKCLRIGMEGEGQDRRVVVASMILGLRESLHGEGGGLTSGSEGGS